MDWSDLATGVFALAGMALSYLVSQRAQQHAGELATQAQITERSIAQQERLAERASAFRDDQVAIVERVLKECLDLFPLTQGISQRWTSGEPQVEYGLPPDAGPGVEHPSKHGETTHKYHGTDMYALHMGCRNIDLLVNRIDDSELRSSVQEYTGRNENFRLRESTAGMAEEIWQIQLALDDLFKRGGAYSRKLTEVDGNWYRSFAAEQSGEA